GSPPVQLCLVGAGRPFWRSRCEPMKSLPAAAPHLGSLDRCRRRGRTSGHDRRRPLRQSGDPALNAEVTVRSAVYSLLREFGLTTVFGNPGSTELPMFRDFPADFRYVLGLQESIVVAMADGFAEARSGAALVNLHSAIGVGHALGSIF